jgi:hypothetical protein
LVFVGRFRLGVSFWFSWGAASRQPAAGTKTKTINEKGNTETKTSNQNRSGSRARFVVLVRV